MNCYHSINDIPCPYSKLKGASAAVNNNPPKQYVFNQSEVNLLGKSLEVCRYFIGKNQAQYQNPENILNELSTSINIINSRQNKSSLKGASSNKICNETKKQSLQYLLKLFNLNNDY
jgi:hypothetical protein